MIYLQNSRNRVSSNTRPNDSSSFDMSIYRWRLFVHSGLVVISKSTFDVYRFPHRRSSQPLAINNHMTPITRKVSQKHISTDNSIHPRSMQHQNTNL